MSVFQFIADKPQPILKKITGNTATTIVDATNNSKWVPWFEVNENAGGTQNLTVTITDGTTSYYPSGEPGDGSNSVIYVAKAVTANLSLKFREGYVIPKSFSLKITSSDASGKFDVIGTVVDLA